MKIISPRERKTVTEYFLYYTWNKHPDSGFMFDCDEHGRLKDMPDAALENYKVCQRRTEDITFQGMKHSTYHYTDPAVGECSCGHHVTLSDPLDNDCGHCGKCYNMVGQEVYPSTEEIYDY